MTGHVPHARTVIAFCIVAIAGYGAFSVWAVFYSADPTLTGDVVGTWKSFAVAAFAFWLGSSSGGKSKDAESQSSAEKNRVLATMADTASGKPNDPLHVEVE